MWRLNECGWNVVPRSFVCIVVWIPSHMHFEISKSKHRWKKRRTQTTKWNFLYLQHCSVLKSMERWMIAVSTVNIFSWRICTHIFSRLHFVCWPHCVPLELSCGKVASLKLPVGKVFSKWTELSKRMKCNEFHQHTNTQNEMKRAIQTHKLTQTNIYLYVVRSQALDDVGLSAFRMCAIRINVHALGNSCHSHSLAPHSEWTKWHKAVRSLMFPTLVWGIGEFMTHSLNFYPYTYLMLGTWQHFRLQFLHTNMYDLPIYSWTDNWNSFLMRGNVLIPLGATASQMASFLLSSFVV